MFIISADELPVVDLATITGAYIVQSGEILSGTAGANAHITVAAGATITLWNANITSITDDQNHQYAGITCAGDVTLILSGDNKVKGGYENYPSIFILPDHTLTIKGSGSLMASSHGRGAGIGGGYDISCGNIVIEGGEITATGGGYAAGIGSGQSAPCGTITISGGTVKATGGDLAAGIGSGQHASCGTITITDGVTKVTAKKGSNAPNSIGAGSYGSCAGVTIGGKVTGNIPISPYTYKP